MEGVITALHEYGLAVVKWIEELDSNITKGEEERISSY